MAGYELIDGYAEVLRHELRWHRRRDDIVDEVTDHLYEGMDRLRDRGVEPTVAARRLLDDFGRPGLVAATFASSDSGGIALPTTFTRSAGRVAIAAGVFYLLGLLAWGASDAADSRLGWGVESTAAYMASAAAVLAGGVLMLVSLMALSRRCGGLGPLGSVGLGVAGLGVVASFVLWAVPLWLTLQAAGTLLVGVAALRTGVAPRAPLVAFSAGLVLAAIATWLGEALASRAARATADIAALEQGWAAALIAAGLVVFAAGLIGLGRWMGSEEPADFPTDGMVAA